MNESYIDSQVQILDRCKLAWENIATTLPEDLSAYGIPGMTKTAVSNAFPMLITRLGELRKLPLEQLNPFLIQTIAQNFPSWTGPMEGWISSIPSNPTTYFQNTVSHLNTMWSQLNAYYSEPNVAELRSLTLENKRLQMEVNNLLKLNTRLGKRKDEITDALSKAKVLTRESKELIDEIAKSKAAIEVDANVTSMHRTTIEADQPLITEHLNKLIAATNSISDFEKKCSDITETCEKILIEAKDRLDAASRAGMATSFSKRAAEYEEPREGWLFLFLMSLAAISLIGYFFIFQEIKDKNGLERLYIFITELPITLPFVWLAWFSALRFSQLGRLREDYEFKVATALSLDGYLKQAEHSSPELKEKLLDIAITNFGENPLRLMTRDSAKDAHPLAGSVDEKTWAEVLKVGIQTIAERARK